jgi:hypothetical protein
MQAGGRVRHHVRGEGTIVEVPRLGKVGIPGDLVSPVAIVRHGLVTTVMSTTMSPVLP